MIFHCSIIMVCCAVVMNVSGESLREYADKIGLNIGVAMGTQFDNNNQTHNNLVKQEFNTVVAENSMKAASIHPSKGKTNFDGPDKLVAFAEENQMKVRGHTLVWHSQNASWITTGTRAEVLQNMQYHIQTVMSHFKGKIIEWDVVNEAFEDAGSELRNSAWLQTVGSDFIDSAFVYAHRVDPDCKLFYNDFSTSGVNAKSTAVYTMVKKMLENGIPIHGVGFQSHQSTGDGGDPEGLYNNVKTNFERFAALGLDISITELDVKGSDFTAQASVYATFMKIALEIPEVKTYMIWGVRDQDSWVSPTPLIFDNSFQPKEAYTAILEELKVYRTPAVHVPNGQTAIGQRSVSIFYNQVANSIMLSTTATAKCVAIYSLDGSRLTTATLYPGVPLHLSSLPAVSRTYFVAADGRAMHITPLH